MNNIVRAVKTAVFVCVVAVLTACGGGGGGGGGNDASADERFLCSIPPTYELKPCDLGINKSALARSGGVCTGSGNTYNCQGRICTRAGSVVVCPDGQSCPFPENLQETSNPVCASGN